MTASQYDDLLRNGERKIVLSLVAAVDGTTRGTTIGPNSERSRDRLLERGYIEKQPDPSQRYVVTDAGRAWAAETIRGGVWNQWTANATERRQWNQARDRLLTTGYASLPTI